MPDVSIGFLRSPRGQSLLRDAVAAYDETDLLQTAEALRHKASDLSAEHISAALTTIRLRQRAEPMFGDRAGRMYFTDEGLQQATTPRVAEHRAATAQRVASGRLVDLCCGIGSDLIAFAAAGFAVAGVEADPVTAAVAAANLRALGLPGSVAVARAESVSLHGVDVAFVDPSRRRGTSRLFDPRSFSPPWDFVLDLLGLPAALGLAVAKMAPGLDHSLIPPGVEAEWVSLDGDLREVALWSPAPASARRRATVLRSRSSDVATCTDRDLPGQSPDVGVVGRYLYEPDDAVVRSHLVAVVAEAVNGWLLDPHLAYVSSDRADATPLARAFRVDEVLPFREKQLKQALRERHVGAVTIKKRGIEITPEVLRRRLDLHGPEQATLVLSRTPRSAVALLVEPLDRDRQVP